MKKSSYKTNIENLELEWKASLNQLEIKKQGHSVLAKMNEDLKLAHQEALKQPKLKVVKIQKVEVQE